MAFESTALIMLGMQRDCFSPDSPIRELLEEGDSVDRVLDSLLAAAKGMCRKDGLIIHIPITYQPGYPEIKQETGLMAGIKKHELLQAGSDGSEPIAALDEFEPGLITLAGCTTFNAFRNTELDHVLGTHRIQRILLGGTATGSGINYTARMAYELGYEVVILEDCILSNSPAEHDLYCNSVFSKYTIPAMSAEFFEPA